MSDVKTMGCVYCGTVKAWPEAFPSRQYAQCWQCAWDQHVHDSHPEILRRLRRTVRKRARRIAARDELAAAFESEKRQLLGISPTNPCSHGVDPARCVEHRVTGDLFANGDEEQAHE